MFSRYTGEWPYFETRPMVCGPDSFHPPNLILKDFIPVKFGLIACSYTHDTNIGRELLSSASPCFEVPSTREYRLGRAILMLRIPVARPVLHFRIKVDIKLQLLLLPSESPRSNLHQQVRRCVFSSSVGRGLGEGLNSELTRSPSGFSSHSFGQLLVSNGLGNRDTSGVGCTGFTTTHALRDTIRMSSSALFID